MSLLGGIIAGGAGLIGSLINRGSQKKTNQKAENFSREMYNRQRGDAVSDWNMQNAYNDPSAQMQRLKDAGLNPHLVYGNGADAQSTAPVRSSQASQPNFQAPKLDAGSIVHNALMTRQLQSNIARTDAETAGIMARTKEQDYRNMAFTPELFTKELETKIEAQQSASYSSRMSGDLSNVRADIADLELQNQNLISGRVEGSDRQVSSKMSNQANMYYDRFQADIQNIIGRTQHTMQSFDNLQLQNQLLKFEADLIKNLGVNQHVAGQLLSNFMKIFLLKMR